MNLSELRSDCARKQKRGIHFIIASVFIWCLVMVVAMIFGAHLMPYGWLYQSKSYLVLSVLIPMTALIVGLNYPPFALAGIMVMIEIAFCVGLAVEEHRSKMEKQLNQIEK